MASRGAAVPYLLSVNVIITFIFIIGIEPAPSLTHKFPRYYNNTILISPLTHSLVEFETVAVPELQEVYLVHIIYILRSTYYLRI